MFSCYTRQLVVGYYSVTSPIGWSMFSTSLQDNCSPTPESEADCRLQRGRRLRMSSFLTKLFRLKKRRSLVDPSNQLQTPSCENLPSKEFEAKSISVSLGDMKCPRREDAPSSLKALPSEAEAFGPLILPSLPVQDAFSKRYRSISATSMKTDDKRAVDKCSWGSGGGGKTSITLSRAASNYNGCLLFPN